MTNWLETYRGVVNPWECDVVQHFTIGYYFDRFASATRNFFDLAGVGESLDAGVRHGPSRGHATFLHELRAGAGFHILTAVTSIDARTLGLDDGQAGDLARRNARDTRGPRFCGEAEARLARRVVAWSKGAGPSHAKAGARTSARSADRA